MVTLPQCDQCGNKTGHTERELLLMLPVTHFFPSVSFKLFILYLSDEETPEEEEIISQRRTEHLKSSTALTQT